MSSRGSSRNTSRSTASRRRKRSDGHALRKYVLTKNMKKRITKSTIEAAKQFINKNRKSRSKSRSMELQPPVFELFGPQKIRIKRTVHVEEERIAVYTTTYISSIDLNSSQYSRALDSQMACPYQYRPKERNPWETVSQTVYFGRRMIRVVRDVIIDRRQLSSDWQVDDNRSDSGFSTDNGQESKESAVEVKSLSTSGPSGYKSLTATVIAFQTDKDDGDEGLKLIQNGRKTRAEEPNLEDAILLEERVEGDSNRLKLLHAVHLLPQLSEVEVGAFVEEVREYVFNPAEDGEGRLKEESHSWKAHNLNQSKRSLDGSSTFIRTSFSTTLTPQTTQSSTFSSTPQTKSEYTTPSSGLSTAYNTPDIKADESKSNKMVSTCPGVAESQMMTPLLPSSVHPIAIPGAKSLPSRQPPRLKLDDHELLSPDPKRVFSPGTRRISADVSLEEKQQTPLLPIKEPQLSIEVTKKGNLTAHRHSLTLAAEIGGEAYEFTGNICYNGEPQLPFSPKRVLVDGKVLWQHSNEWNPTSITSSQINMTMNNEADK